MVGRPPVVGREALGQPNDLDGQGARQQAGLDREQPVEGARLMEPEHRDSAVAGMEGEFHLVAIVERLWRRAHGPDDGVTDPAQPNQGLADLGLLETALLGVVEVLEPAPAADLDVGAGVPGSGEGDERSIASIFASAYARLTRVIRTRSRSSGNPRSTNTTRPSCRATALPPSAMSVTSTFNRSLTLKACESLSERRGRQLPGTGAHAAMLELEQRRGR